MLMMLGDKKKLSQTVVDKITQSEPDMQEPEMDYGMAKEEAMKKFSSGLEGKDYKKMAEGMQEFLACCEGEMEVAGPSVEVEIEPKE